MLTQSTSIWQHKLPPNINRVHICLKHFSFFSARFLCCCFFGSIRCWIRLKYHQMLFEWFFLFQSDWVSYTRSTRSGLAWSTWWMIRNCAKEIIKIRSISTARAKRSENGWRKKCGTKKTICASWQYTQSELDARLRIRQHVRVTKKYGTKGRGFLFLSARTSRTQCIRLQSSRLREWNTQSVSSQFSVYSSVARDSTS